MGAFDDGAAVGEDGHFVGRNLEAQKEIVAANGGEGMFEAAAEFGEIEMAAALVDLNGVAPAHGDVRLGLTFEISEIMLGAGAAGFVAFDANGLDAILPDVAGDETIIEGGAIAGEEFEGFGGLD